MGFCIFLQMYLLNQDIFVLVKMAHKYQRIKHCFMHHNYSYILHLIIEYCIGASYVKKITWQHIYKQILFVSLCLYFLNIHDSKKNETKIEICVTWIKAEMVQPYQNASDGIFVVKPLLIKSIYRSTYIECKKCLPWHCNNHVIVCFKSIFLLGSTVVIMLSICLYYIIIHIIL